MPNYQRNVTLLVSKSAQIASVGISTQQLIELTYDRLEFHHRYEYFPKARTARNMKISAAKHNAMLHLWSQYLWLIIDVCQGNHRQTPLRCHPNPWDQSEKSLVALTPSPCFCLQWKQDHTLPLSDFGWFLLFVLHFLHPNCEGWRRSGDIRVDARPFAHQRNTRNVRHLACMAKHHLLSYWWRTHAMARFASLKCESWWAVWPQMLHISRMAPSGDVCNKIKLARQALAAWQEFLKWL